jgi:NDP-sugar pyrophosphorylase family protein
VPDAILPTAGKASRMRGLPKFLLPAGAEHLTLLELHVNSLLKYCDTVWIPTRPEQVLLLDTLGFASDRVVILPMTTETMTETILRVTQISSSKRFIMCMPDTFFSGQKPYEFLSQSESEMALACWNIREDQMGKLGQVLIEQKLDGRVLDAQDKSSECTYPHSWGAMAFDRSALNFATPEMPHIGYVLPKMIEVEREIFASVMDGEYFDCGTPEEYLRMLTRSVE